MIYNEFGTVLTSCHTRSCQFSLGIMSSETPKLADRGWGPSPVGESLLGSSLLEIIDSVSFFSEGIVSQSE